MNILIITGNLGRDAEQRFMPNGDSLVSFSVPASSGYGEKKKTSWVNCSMFGKRGESVLPYLTKGTLVGVSGEFSMREWIDKDGAKRLSPELRVAEISLLGGGSGKRESNVLASNTSEQKTQPVPGSFDDFQSDIPF